MAKVSFAIERVQDFQSAYDSGKFSNWKELGEAIGMKDDAHVRALRRQAESLYQRRFESFNPKFSSRAKTSLPYGCLDINFDKEVNLVTFSDCHFWPTSMTPPSESFYILCKVIQELAQDDHRELVIVLNGDGFDGASISRHPSIRWEEKPTVKEELEACAEYLEAIVAAADDHPNVKLYWTWGNHDERFDSRLANVAPQFNGVAHTSLVDHFPEWTFTQSLLINDCAYFVHDIAKGKHAAYNNAMSMGPMVHVFTGHTHRLHTRTVTFFRGKAKATETGTIATRNGPQFQYVRGNQTDWQEGFIVGQILGNEVYDEMIEVDEGRAMFRGEFIEVQQ